MVFRTKSGLRPTTAVLGRVAMPSAPRAALRATHALQSPRALRGSTLFSLCAWAQGQLVYNSLFFSMLAHGKNCASRMQCHACMSNAEAQPILLKSVKIFIKICQNKFLISYCEILF